MVTCVHTLNAPSSETWMFAARSVCNSIGSRYSHLPGVVLAGDPSLGVEGRGGDPAAADVHVDGRERERRVGHPHAARSKIAMKFLWSSKQVAKHESSRRRTARLRFPTQVLLRRVHGLIGEDPCQALRFRQV